jgi:hypothetical protein
MSDLQTLFLVLVLLYAWECACWVPRGSVVFSTCWGWRWRMIHPGTLLGNARGGFVFACPLPPLGTLLTGNQFPLSLSPEGMLAFVATSTNPGWRPPQTGRFLRFDEIRSLESDGKRVRVNGEVWLKTTTRVFAEELVQWLRQLSRMTLEQRAAAINEVFQTGFHAQTIAQRWGELRKQVTGLRWLTNALFVYLFVLSPIVIWYFGLKLCWPGLLAGLLALTSTTAILFRRAHKSLYPQADDERFTHFLTILLSPLTAIRAIDVLSRPLLGSCHPLAIARVFCTGNAFRDYARRVLLDVRHPCLPLCPTTETGQLAAELYARTTLLQVVERFLKQDRIDPDNLVKPPKPADETCLSYCPRCEGQFTTVTGTCPDCGGVELMELTTSPSDHAK